METYQPVDETLRLDSGLPHPTYISSPALASTAVHCDRGQLGELLFQAYLRVCIAPPSSRIRFEFTRPHVDTAGLRCLYTVTEVDGPDERHYVIDLVRDGAHCTEKES